MNLSEIKNPEFIKTLSEMELNDLSFDIRELIIKTVAKNGGHLISNLSMVEVTVAMHYVFNAPFDHFIFDSGYACYAHKILTGRSQGFKDLRRMEGVSGYIAKNESPYDEDEALRAGDSLGIALGLAYERSLNNTNEEIVAVIGEEAINSGRSFENLKLIARSNKKVIIIVNDNADYEAKSEGGFSKFVNNLRYSSEYSKIKKDLKENLGKSDLGLKMISSMSSIKNSIKRKVTYGSRFIDLGFDYEGPINGHNLTELIKALNKAKTEDKPIIIHVLTKKGRGYEPLESGLKIEGSLSQPFNVDTSKTLSTTPKGYRYTNEIIVSKLHDLIKQDKIIAIINSSQNNYAYKALFSHDRSKVIDTMIYESSSFLIAAKIRKYQPVIVMSSLYLLRGFDELLNYIIKPNLKVTIILTDAFLNAYEGKGHQGIDTYAILSLYDNVKIASAYSYDSINTLIDNSLNHDGPSIIYIENSAYKIKEDDIKINDANWHYALKKDNDLLVIITYGNSVNELKKEIEINELPISLLNAVYLDSLDDKALDEIIKRKIPLLVYELNSKTNSLGQKIQNYFNAKKAQNKLSLMALDDDRVVCDAKSKIKTFKEMDFKSIIKEIKNL